MDFGGRIQISDTISIHYILLRKKEKKEKKKTICIARIPPNHDNCTFVGNL